MKSVGEKFTGASSGAAARGPFILSSSIAALILTFCPVGSVRALPTGGRVVEGQASIESQIQGLSISASDRSILHFTNFNIAADEQVRFVQPSASSRVLVRATDGTPSEIFGKLTANGRLVLANEAGIHFGEGSSISVGGLIAAAGRVADEDFLSGNGALSLKLTVKVPNAGAIESGGNVVLAGLEVENTGTIVAPAGTVAMQAGAQAVVVEENSDIYVVDAGLSDQKTEAAPIRAAESQKVGVNQAGKFLARSAFLGAGDIYSVGIRHSGRTAAKIVAIQTPAKAEVSGEIEAAGGGFVIIRGGEGVTFSASSVRATGEEGGGNVAVGGATLQLDAASVLDPSATGSGNGGVIGIGGDAVMLEGKLAARGGFERIVAGSRGFGGLAARIIFECPRAGRLGPGAVVAPVSGDCRRHGYGAWVP